jgi:hypothetical protein
VDLRFSGKHALVTGSSAGIGENRFFTGAIGLHLWRGAKTSPFDDRFTTEERRRS